MRQPNASAYVRAVLCLVLLSATAIDGQALHHSPINAAVASSKASASAAAAAYENDMVCWTTTGSVLYISDVFNAGQAPPGPRGRQGSQIAQVFLAFLQKKYGLTAQDHALCGGPPAPSPEATQAYKQQQEELAKKANKKIVETGWKKE